MASKAIRTQGTQLQYENPTSSGTYLPIGEAISWDGPGGKAAIIDTTNLASTFKEKLPGLPDEGAFGIVVNFDGKDPGQLQMQADRAAQALRKFKITFSNSATALFNAYVMEFKVTGKADSKVEAAINMEITGQVTWGAAP
jgi:hypothetical protein